MNLCTKNTCILFKNGTYTTGKVRGGGIHAGRLRSAMAFFSPFTFGRLASSGEKMRLLIETTRKNSVVKPLAASSGARLSGSGKEPDDIAWLTCWRPQSAPVINATWLGIATAYLAYPVWCIKWLNGHANSSNEYGTGNATNNITAIPYGRSYIDSSNYGIRALGTVTHQRDQRSWMQQQFWLILWALYFFDVCAVQFLGHVGPFWGSTSCRTQCKNIRGITL